MRNIPEDQELIFFYLGLSSLQKKMQQEFSTSCRTSCPGHNFAIVLSQSQCVVLSILLWEMNVCFSDKRSQKSMDLPQIYTNVSDELFFQHIQMPGLLSGKPRQLTATYSCFHATQWSTWAKRRKPKSWSERHQSPIQRALPTCKKFESSCTNRVCRARSMLVAHSFGNA